MEKARQGFLCCYSIRNHRFWIKRRLLFHGRFQDALYLYEDLAMPDLASFKVSSSSDSRAFMVIVSCKRALLLAVGDEKSLHSFRVLSRFLHHLLEAFHVFFCPRNKVLFHHGTKHLHQQGLELVLGFHHP